ncbi:MAG TPA: InlB B-repeat-containing protein [Acidimicrobiales bacterium]|nr:InlB B-repeat-containing protein [Acidimicrobiales bacterium]
MGTSTAVTVTPIFWAPSPYTFPTTYKNLIDQFIADVAHDNGSSTNVFSNLTQYTDGVGNPITYDIAAGSAVSDSDAYPTSGGCTADTGEVYSDGTGYSACLTDAQIGTELVHVLTTDSLPSDLNHIYLVFLPKAVESCFGTLNNTNGGQCSISAQGGAFCGYHSSASFGTGSAAPPIYADLPYAIWDSPVSQFTCSSDAGALLGGSSVGNQSPNGNLDADTVISVMSHEMNESITDPEGSAWFDGGGNEIGDDCAYIYGDSSTFGGTSGSEYNQTINGDHYFIQGEFSDYNFARNPQDSCVQGSFQSVRSVTFNANGGSGSMGPESDNAAAALTPNGFTRAGYTFTGWNTAANGSGTAYGDGATYSFISSVTLYAQWLADTFTVTFNANGGSGSMAAQSANAPSALAGNGFTRSGYTFTGWNTAPNGGGTSYGNGATYPFTSSVTLYAQWLADTFTVTFNANGGSGSMAAESHNAATALTANGFKRPGYSFLGWNTAANGSGTSYGNGAAYPFTASVTLYARWKANTPVITIDTSSLTFTGGSTTAKLGCSHAACRGTVLLAQLQTSRVKKGKKTVNVTKTVVLGSTSYSIKLGKSGTEKITLNIAGRGALARASSSHPLVVELKATVARGKSRSKTLNVV